MNEESSAPLTVPEDRQAVLATNENRADSNHRSAVAPDPGNWAVRLGWILSASYAIGLIIHRVYNSIHNYPPVEEEHLFDISRVVYGGLMLSLSLLTRLATMAMFERRAYRTSFIWWENVGKHSHSDPPNVVAKAISMFIWWAITVMTYIAPYFATIFFICVFITGAGWEPAGWIAVGLGATSLAWWLLSELERLGKTAVEQDLLSPHTASILGIADGDRRAFSSSFFLILFALSTGYWMFPYAKLELGGGRPAPIKVVLSDKADTLHNSSLRGVSGRSMYLAEPIGSFVALLPSPTGWSSALFLPREYVAAVLPGTDSAPVLKPSRSATIDTAKAWP